MHNYSDEIEFLSIVIPSFCRYNYLKELVDSIHKHADTAFELIIHDEPSNDGTREKILKELGDGGLVSSVILNNGLNLGLSESINRATRVAGSNYILMMNSDCRIERPFFKDLINILKCPFVGAVFPSNPVSEQSNKLKTENGTTFYFSRGIGAGWCQAWRKDNFEAIGGWDNFTTTTGNADVNFMCRMLRSGYFLVSPDYPIVDKNVNLSQNLWVTNLSNDRVGGSDSCIAFAPEHIESGFPLIFNLDDSLPSYKRLSQERQGKVSERQGEEYRKEGGYVNINYWNNFGQTLINDKYDVNWEVAKRYGHDKWKNVIEKRLVK